jgi:hypothetical protein
MTDYKIIYLARRKAGMAEGDFPAAWREHSRYAGQVAPMLGRHIASVHQCVKIHGADVPASFRNDHDGSALIGMRSWDDLMSARYHPVSLNELRQDEERHFADYVDNWTNAAETVTVLDRGKGEAAILSFLARRPDVDAAAFDDGVMAACDALAERPPAGLVRIVRNRVVDMAAPPYDFAAVVELWFGDEPAAVAAANDAVVLAAVEQAGVAEVDRGARLLARLNLQKASVVADDGAAAWTIA